MKKIITLSLFLVLCYTTWAQQKRFLFDATKAETAGNADWVIDADQHNLGFPNGPAVIGLGDESNPQILPTPAQSTVTASTSESYWEGALSSWGIDLVKKGYYVETLPYNGAITYGNTGNAQDLSHYNVFIVCEPNIVFTSAEKTALLQFIQNGGGLMMVSDHDNSDRNNDNWDSPHIWDDLITNNSIKSDPFGMTFDYADFSQTSTNIPNLPGDPLLHGIMGNVTEVQWSNGTTMTLNPNDNSTVKGIIYKTGSSFGNTNAMVAYASYGSGRVVGFGDSSPCDDGSGDPNDNLYDGWITDAGGNHEKLIINASIWLAEGSGSVSVQPLQGETATLDVSPNPSQGSFNIHFMNGVSRMADVKLFNMTGEEIFSENVYLKSGANSLPVVIKNNLKGIFILKVVTPEGVLSSKVVIE